MPLPTIATPTYELELPSSKQLLNYRPFLVKEEKLLVLALESDCLLYTSPSPRDKRQSRMPSSA